MEHLNVHKYYGSIKSGEGWQSNIGNFHILDARLGFRRYIAHEKPRRLHEIINDLQEVAENYGLMCSKVIRTRCSNYSFIKYFQVFFLGEGMRFFDLSSIQKRLEEPLKKGKIMLALQQDRTYKRNTTGVIDINKKIKSLHEDLINSLDEIMFSKTP